MPGVVDLDLGPRSSDVIMVPETKESDTIYQHPYSPDTLQSYVKWGQMSSPSDQFMFDIVHNIIDNSKIGE